MTRRTRHTDPPQCSRGFTLVEVLAALALLAGTVTCLLLAETRALRQHADAQRRAEVTALAEELIRQWKVEQVELSQPAAGFCEAEPRLRWQRTVEPFQTASNPTLLRVTLRLLELDQGGNERTLTTLVWLINPPEESA